MTGGYTDPGVKVTTAPLVTVDVLPAKVAQAVVGEELVCIGNVVHIIHETKGSVGQDSGVGLHELDGLVGEGPNLVHAGLGTAVEVLHASTQAVSAYGENTQEGYTDLARKLGKTERFPETGPLVDVGLEVFELDVIPVNGNLIDVAVTATLVEEVGHPREAVGVGGGDGASESVTLVGKRPKILVPDTDSVVWSGLGLRVLVDPGGSGKSGSVLSA